MVFKSLQYFFNSSIDFRHGAMSLMLRIKTFLACLACVLLAAAFAVPARAQLTFDFTNPDFSDGLLNGQQGWNAETGWTVVTSDGGYATTDTNNEIATYLTPVVLTNPMDSFGYSINMQFAGTYATPAAFAYLFLSGLKVDNTNASLGLNTSAADANIQVVANTDNYRLLNAFAPLAGASTISTAALNEGDVLQFDYNFTLGTDAATSAYTVQLQNLTDSTDSGVGTVTGVDQALYDAITGDGAFAFFQRHNPNPGAGPTGLTNLRVNSISGDFGDPIDPDPPSPIFLQDDAPPSGITQGSGIVQAGLDPLDASNDVAVVTLTPTGGNFKTALSATGINATPYEGQKFRAAFDYLVPEDSAFDENDTFYLQIGFNDPISIGVAGGGNSASAGFPTPAELIDGAGVWQTVELLGFIPENTAGAEFRILIRDNSGGNAPDTDGLAMYIDNLSFEVIEEFPVLPGDFNNDGVVNLADYTVWRDNLGAAPPTGPEYAYEDVINASGEAVINFAGDGMNGVDSADYLVWKNNFGMTSTGISAISAAAVPEPATGILLLGAVASIWAAMRRSRVEGC